MGGTHLVAVGLDALALLVVGVLAPVAIAVGIVGQECVVGLASSLCIGLL